MIDIHRLQVALAQNARVADLLLSAADHGFVHRDDSDADPLLTAATAMFVRLHAQGSPWAPLYWAMIFGWALANDASPEAWRAWAASELGSELPVVHGTIDVRAALAAWLAKHGRALPVPPPATPC